MVKAGALGDTHDYVAWDQTWPSSDHKKTIGWADGVKITSRRYYGRRKPNLERGQDGRVVKAGSLEILTIKLRGIEPGQVLITKSP